MTPAHRLFPLLFALFVVTDLALGQPDPAIDSRVNELLGKMTLDEKIGQITQLAGVPFLPDSMKVDDRIRKGQDGSVLWVTDPKEINRLQKIAVEESRLHIPIIFGLDVIHGYRTIFPIPLAMAASWEPALIEHSQAIAAREAASAGIRWTFAPMLDIARDARWGRIMEGAGEDPYLGAAVARAQVRGFQGDRIGAPDRILACAKHFAGYGAADGGRDYDSAYISDDLLWNVYLPPFKAALDAGVATFMSAYMDLNGVPATGNKFLLRDVLRKEWNYQGFVVSDANAVGDLVTHGFARDREDAAYRAFTAGVDMDMVSHTYLENLAGLVRQGRVREADIDHSVRSILAAKFRLGLFEHPYADAAQTDRILNAPEHRQMARVAAQRSIVLLRNEGGVLPLSKSAAKSIAVIGPLANTRRDMMSAWTPAGVNPEKNVAILEGIRAKLPVGARVEYAQGSEIQKPFKTMFDMVMGDSSPAPWTPEQSQAEFQKAVDLARASDLVVMGLGEYSSMSGELGSQSSLSLPGRQEELLEAVTALGKPVVVVLISGRPLNVTWASSHVAALVEAWHPGMEGGNAIADVLFGDVNPGGKLPVTWPRSEGQIPIYYAHNLTHQPEGSPMFSSRYWDIPASPLYPFGYGLSYASFTYSDLKLSREATPVGGSFEASVDVENAGKVAGDEVAQLYIHQRAGSASRPIRELKGFQKIALQPGEKKTVRFTLGPNELCYWSQQEHKWLQEAEKFDLWVGGDSTAKLHANFAITN